MSGGSISACGGLKGHTGQAPPCSGGGRPRTRCNSLCYVLPACCPDEFFVVSGRAGPPDPPNSFDKSAARPAVAPYQRRRCDLSNTPLRRDPYSHGDVARGESLNGLWPRDPVTSMRGVCRATLFRHRVHSYENDLSPFVRVRDGYALPQREASMRKPCGEPAGPVGYRLLRLV